MKVLLLTHNFTPDLGAASFRMDALVRELSTRGHKVYVLTAYPNRYSSLDTKIEDDFNDNVSIHRVRSKKQKNNLLKRFFSYMDFFLKAYLVGRRLAKRADLILATSPPIFTGYLGAILAKKYKMPFILDIRDLWPDAMLDLNLTTKRSLIYKVLKKIELFMYKESERIVINSPAFEVYIRQYYFKNINLVTNGLDDYIYHYFKDKKVNTEITGRKINVLYAGNLGIAQDIDILTRLNKNISKWFNFLLIGDGSQKEEIERNIKVKGIKNIFIKSPLERKTLLKEYEKADAFFVHLRNIPMFAKTIPSKLFEYVATKKPVVYGLKGVAKEIMDELGGEYSFEPGNVTSLEKALEKLKYDLEKGRWFYKENQILKQKYLRSNLSKKFADIIEEVYDEVYQNN